MGRGGGGVRAGHGAGLVKYGYLLRQPLYSLTAERRERLEQQRTEAEEEFARLERLEPQDMWLKELATLREVVEVYLAVREAAVDSAWDAVKQKSSAKKRAKTSRK